MDTILGFILHHSHPLIQRRTIQFCPQTRLICFCQRARTQKNLHIASNVLRLSSHITVQYGWGISPSRAAMQEYAYQRVDPTIVRVPQVYRFFEDYSTGYSLPDGYLFMEHIPGKTVEELDAATEDNAVSKVLTKRIADIVVHLQGIKAEDGVPPGPVSGGMLFGYLWGEEGTKTAFNSALEMNYWLNRRLKLIDKSIDLSPCYPLVLCHGDLVRRNIVVIDDGDGREVDIADDYEERRLALVDWGHAALLPRVCEFASISCYIDKGAYSYTQGLQQAAREAIGGLTEVEEECHTLLMSARALSLRYTKFD